MISLELQVDVDVARRGGGCPRVRKPSASRAAAGLWGVNRDDQSGTRLQNGLPVERGTMRCVNGMQ